MIGVEKGRLKDSRVETSGGRGDGRERWGVRRGDSNRVFRPSSRARARSTRATDIRLRASEACVLDRGVGDEAGARHGIDVQTQDPDLLAVDISESEPDMCPHWI